MVPSAPRCVFRKRKGFEMSEFFDEIEADGEKVIDAVEGVFGQAVTAAEAFVKSLADWIAANGGQILIDAALAGVAAAETAGGTGPAKLAAAVSAVETSLVTQGVSAAKSAINGAVEAAVATLPKAQPAVEVTGAAV